jgi:acyl dehydratase
MSLPTLDTLKVGHVLPELKLPPITRYQLALYCGGSGDHNPIHVDIDFAKSAGMKDVFAYGEPYWRCERAPIRLFPRTVLGCLAVQICTQQRLVLFAGE